eukprot:CCRYP_019571-RA/>CCRYP_019571-RA protein AED:0.05 eAED:0.05 QI:552/1/1/1/0/0/2/94/237
MHKYSSIKDFLRNASHLLETGKDAHSVNNSGQTITTTQICLADTSEPESIDTNRLDRRDIERIRKEDPFMYHSITQHIRKMQSSSVALDHDVVDDELGREGHCPADTAAGNPNPGTIFDHNVCVDNSHGTSSHAPNTSSQHCVLHVRTQHFQLSSSLQQIPSSYSIRHQGPLPKSSRNYSTCVVTRQSRFSVETDFSREMADLMASFHTRSDMVSTFQWDSYSDGDLQQVDSYSVGL